MKTDILIAGCGCSGLYCALNLPADKKITIITNSDMKSSDSFLAQGGICVLRDENDYESYFEDTMRAGHYENDRVSVDIMIRSSKDIINDLLSYGTDFKRNDDSSFAYTKEGAHSKNRILFHEDKTGEEISSRLLDEALKRPNITIMEHNAIVDIIEKNNICCGAVCRSKEGEVYVIYADYTFLATGGIGGLYPHSTNFRHLRGDALAIAIRHGIKLKNINYVQIHPTTFYTKEQTERSFLISESVRGEGALLYDKSGKRFVNELLPRDKVTSAILHQMKKDGTPFVWEDLRPIPKDELLSHFPTIVAHCLKKGYDPTKECIPVVPAQHYFMGGIWVNHQSQTSMRHLYAIGETACNGVHGKNRLASNSLLESLVFAKRAALNVKLSYEKLSDRTICPDLRNYENKDALSQSYYRMILREMEKENNAMTA